MKDYSDIIGLPHHTSAKHPRMPRADRAAQFAPFSALTGYGDVIDETARLTDSRLTLSEESKTLLDLKQRLLSELADSHPEIVVTYFEDDKRKSGGAYRTHAGSLKRVDEAESFLLFCDGTRIPFARIYGIDCPIFDRYRLDD